MKEYFATSRAESRLGRSGKRLSAISAESSKHYLTPCLIFSQVGKGETKGRVEFILLLPFLRLTVVRISVC